MAVPVLGWLLWLTCLFISGPRQRAHPSNGYRMNQAMLRISKVPKATGLMHTHKQALFLYSHRLV